MTRYGTVLRFARGTKREDAQAALDKFVKDNPELLAQDHIGEANKRLAFRIEKYDDRFGGPVWYVP